MVWLVGEKCETIEQHERGERERKERHYYERTGREREREVKKEGKKEGEVGESGLGAELWQTGQLGSRVVQLSFFTCTTRGGDIERERMVKVK